MPLDLGDDAKLWYVDFLTECSDIIEDSVPSSSLAGRGLQPFGLLSDSHRRLRGVLEWELQRWT